MPIGQTHNMIEWYLIYIIRDNGSYCVPSMLRIFWLEMFKRQPATNTHSVSPSLNQFHRHRPHLPLCIELCLKLMLKQPFTLWPATTRRTTSMCTIHKSNPYRILPFAYNNKDWWNAEQAPFRWALLLTCHSHVLGTPSISICLQEAARYS